MVDLDDFRLDILKHIYETGGYTTIYNMMKYLGLNKTTVWHHLELLSSGNTKEKYLKKVNDDTRGSREKAIYQVTAKTCSLFGNPDSYYRKKHSREYIGRSLLKNRYFSINKEMKERVIFLHDDKLEHLFSLGFKKEHLPVKHVVNNKITSFEDTLGISSDGVRIIYFDKETVTVKSQVNSLFINYTPMIKSSVSPIKILIITTNQFRELEYIKEIKSFLKSLYKSSEIDNDLVELYASFIRKMAEHKGENTEIIAQNLKDGTIKKALIDRLSGNDKDLKSDDIDTIRSVSKGGIQYILDRVKSMISTEKENIIKNYFMKLLRLNYHDYLIFQDRQAVAFIDVLSSKLF